MAKTRLIEQADILDAGGDSVARVGLGFTSVPIPDALGWDHVHFPLSIGLRDFGGRFAEGSASFNPKQSAAYAACLAGAVFYVDVTKSDTNNGLTPATAVKSGWKAQQLLNATGAPGRIVVLASGTYNKDQNFSIGNAANIPTVDTLWIASGGRVLMTSHASVTTWVADATYPNTYSATRSSVARVVDLKTKGPTGLYREFVMVADAATCNRTPWSWALAGSTLYVNRGDAAVVADTNTRVYLQVPNFIATGATPRNLFLVGETPSDGWDLEGGCNVGGGGGCVTVSFSAAGASPVIFYAERMSARYPGIYGGVSLGQGFTVNSVRGLVMLASCDASGAKSDGFNIHDANAVGGCYFLTVNCTADDCGIQAATSCNGWTTHEGVVGVDIAGRYRGAAGCTVHAINTTKSFLAGTEASGSRGDQIHGGGFFPAEFRVSDQAEMWIFRGRPNPSTAAGYAYQASETGKIHIHDGWPSVGLVSAASGATINNY